MCGVCVCGVYVVCVCLCVVCVCVCVCVCVYQRCTRLQMSILPEDGRRQHLTVFSVINLCCLLVLNMFYACQLDEKCSVLSNGRQSHIYWIVHHCDNCRIKYQLDVTCYIYFLETQHVSGI